MWSLEPRHKPPLGWQILTPILAIAATMLTGAVLFGLIGYDPVAAIRTIFWDPLFGATAGYSRAQLVIKAGPLVLIACGLAVGFRAGIWNIGAEGQYIIGGICGAAVALSAYPANGWWIFPAMILVSAVGGLAWGMIPALLRNWFGASEILVSLMLVYVAEKIAAWMALGPMRNPEGYGMPGSRNLSQYGPASNAELFPNTGIHWGVIAAVFALFGLWILMSRHILGLQIRAAGEAPRAARFSGVSSSALVAFCLGLSGALAGMAGLFEVAGPAGRITEGFGSGYGFTAIIVAFLGRLHPVGILLAGLLMALTYIGGDIAQGSLQLPAATVQLFQGMLLFYLLGFDFITRFRIRWRAGA